MTTSDVSIQPQFRTIDGLSVRFAESEPRDDHALLLSPWPESLFAFEPMWTRLAEHTHLVAVDLPGFGHSERRDALLSPPAMGEFIIRIADAQHTGAVRADLDPESTAEFIVNAWEGALIKTRADRSAAAFDSFFAVVFGPLLAPDPANPSEE